MIALGRPFIRIWVVALVPPMPTPEGALWLSFTSRSMVQVPLTSGRNWRTGVEALTVVAEAARPRLSPALYQRPRLHRGACSTAA